MGIMDQNRSFVKGPKGNNIQAISNRTGAKIMFCDSNSDRGVCYVIITGNLDCVYMAWQEIMVNQLCYFALIKLSNKLCILCVY